MKIESTVLKEEIKQEPSAPAVQLPTVEPECQGLRDEELSALKDALEISYLVYDDAAHVKAELARCHYSEAEFFTSVFTGAQAVCCVRNGRAYIAFRGTASPLDWFMDALAFPFYRPLCHFGFQTTWLSLRGKIRGWLEKTSFDDVALCGHSLGGAMAHIAAMNLAKNYNIANVFTFGAPKACFAGTAERLTETKIKGREDKKLGEVMYCAVNQRDIVAKVPFYWLGYRDVGHLVYIDHNDNIYVREDAESKRSRDSMSDLDFVLGFLETENKAYTGLSVSSAKNLTYYIRQGLFWSGRLLPQLRLVLSVILLYILTCLYFVRSVSNHLTEQYITVFYGDIAAMKLRRKEPSRLGEFLRKIKRAMIVFILSVLFFWGLYEIIAWGISSIADMSSLQRQ